MQDKAETSVRDAIVRWGRSLFERGLTSGSSGNISVRVGDAIIATPTNSCLGFLETDQLSNPMKARSTTRMFFPRSSVSIIVDGSAANTSPAPEQMPDSDG
jgi:hypothetical protein